jgi:Xaa-Pro dipeptidase
MFDLNAVQQSLSEFGLDGWLFYDFRGANILARRVLGVDQKGLSSRRFFYFVPAKGSPVKLVHRIETAALDDLPGDKLIYLRWQELEAGVARLLQGSKRVAMEYAPRVSNPYISRVDGGTIELVKSCGVELVSSGDLIQQFEATWDDAQWQMHLDAEKVTTAAYDVAWGMIAERTGSGGTVRETEVQQAIMDHFHRHGLTTYSPPIVGVGPHSGDPHYEPVVGHDAAIKQGDLVLVDLWAKLDRPRSVYSDLTRMGFVGDTVPTKYEAIFAIVARARDAAIACVKDAYAAGRPLHGWEVDDAGRRVIDAAGYGAEFIHRIGHNIGQEVHGNGANMDNLETHDERLVLKRTCFSIEPGIYFEEFGVRSEINVFVDNRGTVHVTGGLQTKILPILAPRQAD